MSLTSPAHDSTTTTLHTALRALATRQRLLAENIANVETPGYRARRVDFEESLRRAVATGQPALASTTISLSTAAPGPNGNNVALDQDTLALTETGLRYQLLTNAVDAKMRLLRTAIGRGA